MLKDMSLRRSAIAYVYAENPQLTREENLQFYDRVTASGVVLDGFQVQGLELILKRIPAPAKSGLEIRVGPFQPGPKLRLLVAHVVGSDPVTVTRETADLTWTAFQKVWGSRLARPELVEVTLEFAVEAPGGNAVTFLRDRVGRVSHEALERLGRASEGFGFRISSGPAIHVDGPAPPIPGGGIDLRVERLMEPSGSQLFIQATVKWPALTLATEQLPPEVRGKIPGAFLQVNEKASSPNTYLAQVYDYVTGNVAGFLHHASQ